MKKARRDNRGMTSLRVASIDIGSNAIRLFIGQKSKTGRVRVLQDQRESVRLGKDAFSQGYIGPVAQSELERALKRFRTICDDLQVDRIRAVGTSALRDSSNGRQVLRRIRTKTGIHVRLINGHKEASLLHKAVSHSLNLRDKSALLIDMGGGSLEVVMSHNGRVASTQSLPLGTVRLLTKVNSKPKYEDIAGWARTPLYRLRLHLLAREPRHHTDLMVGTGGNLRAIGKLCFRLGLSRSRNRFHRAHLENLSEKLFRLNLQQRMKRFQLKRDRADVILPATVVTLELMRIFEINEVVVPDVGLKNGLFWDSVERSQRRLLRPIKARKNR